MLKITFEFNNIKEAQEALSKLSGGKALAVEAEETSTIRASDLKAKAGKKAKKPTEIEESFLDEDESSDDPADFDDEMDTSEIEDEDSFEEEEEKPAPKKTKAEKPKTETKKTIDSQTLIDAFAAYTTRLAKKHGEDKAVRQAEKILKEYGAKSPRGIPGDKRAEVLARISPKKA